MVELDNMRYNNHFKSSNNHKFTAFNGCMFECFFQSLVWHSESLPSALESFSLSTSEMQRQMMRNALVSAGLPLHMMETNH